MVNRTPPSTATDQLDESVLRSLLQFDEALREGRELDDSAAGLSDSQRSEFARAVQCLLELEHAIPRQKPAAAKTSRIPARVGRFETQQPLGGGAFGVVLKAYDGLLNRTVAIKIPRPHVLEDEDLKKRFLREAQAAAKLDHAHIVPIYEAGEQGDLPYIAYAYCEGPTLAKWMQQRGETMHPKQAAQLMLQLADAVHYSHTQGILHRDIKPANVLLFPKHDPAAAIAFPYVPRLSDLGLAKLIESTLEETMSGMVIGTPLYMSPEQAKGLHADVGPTCDIYSLGAVLYFLLTGRPPFQAAGLIDALTQVIEREPIAPLDLNPAVDRDLNTICLKCLEKVPARRYASAQQLADDFARYLGGEPIRARPASALTRLSRWCRREPAIATLLSSIGVLAAGLVGLSAWYSYASVRYQQQLTRQNVQLSTAIKKLDETLEQADHQREIAEANERRVLEVLYAEDLRLAATSWREGDLRSASLILERHESLVQGRVEREFAWRYLKGKVTTPSRLIGNLDQSIWCTTFSPDQRWLAAAGNSATVFLFDAKHDGALKRVLKTGQVEINSVAFSPDARLMATAGDDGRVGLWNPNSGKLVRWFDVLPARPVFGVSFVDGGAKLVAAGKSAEASLWDVATGALLEQYAVPKSAVIECLAVAPDQQRFALAGAEGDVAVYRLGNQAPELLREGAPRSASVVQFTSDGMRLVAGGEDGTVAMFDGQTGAELCTFQRPEGIRGLAVDDNDRIVCTDRGGVVTLLAPTAEVIHQPQVAPATTPSWTVEKTWIAHHERINAVTFAPDGSVVLGTMDGDLRLWPRQSATSDRVLAGIAPEMNFYYAGMAEGSSPYRLYRVGLQGLEVWETRTDKPAAVLAEGSQITACSSVAPLNMLAIGDNRGRVAVLMNDLRHSPEWHQVSRDSAIGTVAAYAGGRRIVARTHNDELVVIDGQSGSELKRFTNRASFAVSSDERWIAVANHGTNDLSILDADTLVEVARRPAHQSTVRCVEFSRDGDRVLTAGDDRAAIIWDTSDWSIVRTLVAPSDQLASAAFSPDGKTIAIGDAGGSIRLWYAASGQELFELAKYDEPVVTLQFSPDGHQLYANLRGFTTHIFTAPH